MPPPTTRLLFAGGYGIENAGDDLPLVVMSDLLRAKRPATALELRVLSRHPSPRDEERYGVTTVQNPEHASRHEAAGRWFKGLNPGDDPRDLDRIRCEIRRCDALVLGAGNWMIDRTIGPLRGPIPLLAIYVFLAEMYHRPVFLYGVSVGPLETEWGRDLCRWVVERAGVVTVRDRASRDLLASLLTEPREIHHLPEATLAARPPGPERVAALLRREGIEPRPGSSWLALGLRDLAVSLRGRELERAWDELAAFCDGLGPEHELIFIPQCTYFEDDDRMTARRFAARLDPRVRCHFVEGRHHPRDLIGLYQRCDAALAIRLHAAVFAVLGRTPVVALDYLPKVRGFLESVGLGEQAIPVEQIERRRLAQTWEAARRRWAADYNEIDRRISRAGREAEGYADLLLDLLDRSGPPSTSSIQEALNRTR